MLSLLLAGMLLTYSFIHVATAIAVSVVMSVILELEFGLGLAENVHASFVIESAPLVW